MTLQEQSNIINENFEYLDTQKADKTELPTKISDLENDTNFASIFDVEHIVSQIQQFKHEVVEQLPQRGSSNIMYLVPKPNTANVYEEYIWLDEEEKYEDIGSTAVDLSDYAKKSDIPTDYVTTTQLVTLSTQTARYDLSNVSSSIDFVISEQTYNNRLGGVVRWKNGRMEQWGVATTSNTGETIFTMNNSFIDTNFQVFIEPKQAGDLVHYAIPSATNKFKARIQNTSGAFISCQFQWRAYGYWK